MTDTRASILILSFTDIARDARVRRQALLLSDRFRVVTCGYGEPISEGIEHVELDPAVNGGVWKLLMGAAIRGRAYRLVQRLDPRVRAASKALGGRRFDAALANEPETAGLAFRIVGAAHTHLDLHEFYPGLHDEMPLWVRVRKPYEEWALRNLGVLAGSASTVSTTIAERYQSGFGIDCQVVHNAPFLQHVEPGPVGDPIRIVHSGGAQPNRRIEVMMEAVARSTAPVTLDLYLTQQHTAYGQRLRALADELGDRVTVHDPVPQADLVATLNAYDVGIHVLPPTNTNNSLALPNKFFDYVQARLALVIGPTADMMQRLHEFELGVVADGFDIDAVVGALEKLTRESVGQWKRNAHLAAAENCAEAQQDRWLEDVSARLTAK